MTGLCDAIATLAQHRAKSAARILLLLCAMLRVMIADDHAMFREMLRISLPRTGDIEVVGEADNGRDLGEAIYRCRPDVLLLDYKMPHVRDFGTLVKEIRDRHPGTPVIVLSGFAGPDVAMRAAEAGARGYVLKTTRLRAVADAITTVVKGGIWIDPNLPRQTFDVFQRHSVSVQSRNTGLVELTRREREVLACVAQGIANREIGYKLAISERTVKTHLTRIFAKLDVKNRVGAALAFCSGENGAGATPSSHRDQLATDRSKKQPKSFPGTDLRRALV
ncbi:MAG: LuxR C-terminal-related transcriptional regulator [Candidatus Binatia bacterium]